VNPAAAAPARVLVIEDAPEFRLVIVAALRDAGFHTEEAEDGETGVHSAADLSPDVIILDLGLPKLDGLEACRRIRTFSDAYILMLTARDHEVDKVVGLTVGADDYMTKPFSARELVARVHALLRRRRDATPDDGLRRIGDLVVHPLAREVSVGGRRIELTRLEFDLLDVLSSNPRAVFSRARLLAAVWGEDWYGDEHVVDVHISKLRRKLGGSGDAHRHIQTVRGVGFRLAQDL
jgi:DNA-binding response OmpR family regulator